MLVYRGILEHTRAVVRFALGHWEGLFGLHIEKLGPISGGSSFSTLCNHTTSFLAVYDSYQSVFFFLCFASAFRSLLRWLPCSPCSLSLNVIGLTLRTLRPLESTWELALRRSPHPGSPGLWRRSELDIKQYNKGMCILLYVCMYIYILYTLSFYLHILGIIIYIY